MEKQKSLNRIRQEIDRLDLDILLRLRERMAWAVRARRCKEDIEDSDREQRLLKRIEQYGLGLLDPHFARDLFARIIEASKQEQRRSRELLAIQGERGAYSEMAALQYSKGALVVPCSDFEAVFDAVGRGEVDYGVVPVENSIGGAISDVNRLLAERSLVVAGEVQQPIHHCLLMKEGGDHRRLRQVYSHPQALAQCRLFLERHQLEGVPFYDTAGAARMLATSGGEHLGAIASELCSHMYRLSVVMDGIADTQGNQTRFLVLARQKREGAGDKCSLIFTTNDRSGALMDVLRCFAEARINLTRIESMPVAGSEQRYRFYVDLHGSDEDPTVADTFTRVQTLVDEYRLLGCYPRAR